MHSAHRIWPRSGPLIFAFLLVPLTALGQAPGRLPVRVPGTPPAMRNVPSSRDPLVRPGIGRSPSEAPRATAASSSSEPRPVVRGRVGRLPPPPSKSKTTPTKSDGPVPTSGAEEKRIEDVITFKSNYEKDVRCRKLPLNQKISIDFEDAPLEDVLKFIGCVTAQNFITDLKTLKGKTITIMSPKPVTVYEAYKAFLSTLDMNGLTIVPVGKFMKITQSKQAPGDHGPIIMPGRRVRNEDRVVTYLAALDNVQGTDLLDVLAKFKSPNGDLYVYEPTNTLIITDIASNVRRLLKLIKELDLPTGREHIFVRPVLYAEASQLVDKINQLFGQQAGSGKKSSARAPKTRRKPTRPGQKKARGGGVGSSGNAPPMVNKVMADDRTNSLIIVATRTGYLLVDRFLRKMDVPIPGEGELHIYQLQNADAKEMASTLQSLTQGKSSSRTKRPARGKAKSTTSGGGTAALFSGDVKITAHEETNGLLIEASLSDYLTLKKVIEKLDVRRKQVYVEALIMEVTSSKDRKFGPSGSAGTSFEMDGEVVPMLFGLGGLGVGGFDMNQLNKGGLAVGMQGPLVDLSTGSTGTSGVAGTLSIPTFGFLLQAIASNSDVNIISTPHILTLENEEAEIQVGKRIPYQSTTFGGFPGMGNLGALASQMGGSSSSAALSALGGMGMGGYGGFGGGMGTVQFVDADLTLKIKPQVNESNFVRLEIEQSIEDVESIDRTLGPTTSKRKVSNAVVVRDEQPVVIGGLIRNSESEGVDKIPFFGDIPVLGILFRKSATLKEKKNLLMIIVPHIIRDPSDLQRVHTERVAEIRKFNEFLDRRKAEIEGKHDYRKKHGALEEIRRVVGERQEQARILMELERRQDVDILGDPESHRLDFDPEGEPGGAAPDAGTGEPTP